jgi:predicted dehydrogenase
MATAHARHWARLPAARITSIVSLDPEKAIGLASSCAANVHLSFDQCLAEDQPDIVDVCTPTLTHSDIAVAALEAGKHVFLEKPMARTLAECDRIIDAAKKANTIAMVAHVVRFFPEFAAAHAQITAGAVGQIASVRTARMSGYPRGGWHNWYASPAESGGVVLDMIVHDFDWLRWCFGDAARVYAVGLYGKSEYIGSLDYALVTIRFKSGVIAHVCGSWAHTTGFRTTFEVCGDKGMIDHDSIRSVPFTIAKRTEASAAPSVAVPQNPMASEDDPFFKELSHFMHCVSTNSKPSITLADGRAAVAIALAALESIQSGKPVEL